MIGREVMRTVGKCTIGRRLRIKIVSRGVRLFDEVFILLSCRVLRWEGTFYPSNVPFTTLIYIYHFYKVHKKFITFGI